METIAEKLAVAMRAHLEGRGDDAGQEAEAVEPAGGEPPHAEAAGDATVAQIEEVAQRAWDVFQAWEGVWNDGGNINDLTYSPVYLPRATATTMNQTPKVPRARTIPNSAAPS